MITAISGIRDLAHASRADVELVIGEELALTDELIFGGALGVDTVALRAACELRTAGYPKLTVIVPCKIGDQPREAQLAARCADRIVELGLPKKPWAYLRRNDAMLERADRLLAFTDGREEGGTAYTIDKARSAELPVESWFRRT